MKGMKTLFTNKTTFVANGYSKMVKGVKERITNEYSSDLEKAGFWERRRIKRLIRQKVAMELIKLQKEVSPYSLFFKR